jgi:hypothetical protein
MVSNELINRLGFEAWAMNVAVNAIENFVFPGYGNASLESKDYEYRIIWDDTKIEFNLRAYTAKGWQQYSTVIKR